MSAYKSSYYPYWGNNNGGFNNSFNQSYYAGGNAMQNAYPQQPMTPMQAQQMGMQQGMLSQQQMAQMQSYQAAPIKTNKLFVTGVEEAINRSTEFNSETIYFHQDLPVMYEVAVDGKGRKEVYTFDVTSQNNTQQNKETNTNSKKIELTNYVTIDEFNNLKENYNVLNDRFERLLLQLKGNSQQRQKQAVNPQNSMQNNQEDR